MNILITGVGGRVGRGVLDRLIATGVPFRAASRRPEAAALPDGVPVVMADLSRPETLPEVLEGITKVFLYAQPDGVDGFVKAAVEAGVQHVVLLSSSSAAQRPSGTAGFNAERHLTVEQALADSGMAWTFLRPGAFATNSLRWANSIRSEGVVRLPYPEAGLAPIHEADIVDVAMAALTGTGLEGGMPLMSGPESLTQREQVELIGQAIGKPLRFEELTPEQAREEMGRYMPPQYVELLLNGWAASDGVAASVSDQVERITGHPGRTFAQWARDHAADFR